jgi:hypothetical protein
MIQKKELTKLEDFLPLIYDLQEKTWPHEQLSRKAALAKIIQLAQYLGVNFDPNDEPELLKTVMLKIWEVSSQPPELEAPSIPPHLAEFVEDYDKAKREQQEEIRRKLGTQENYNHYQKLTDEFKKIIVRIDSKTPKKLAERMAEDMANKALSSLPSTPVLQEEEKNQALNKVRDIINKRFEKIKSEEAVIKEAEKIVSKEEEKIVEQKEEVVGETGKIIENGWQKILEETQKIIPPPQIIQPIKKEVSLKVEQPLAIEKEIPSLPSSLSPKENHIYQEFIGEVKKTISLAEPEIKEKELNLMAKNAANEIIVSLPMVAQKDFLSEEDKKQIVFQFQTIIQKGFQQIDKKPQNKIDVQSLVQQIQPVMEPKFITTFKEAQLKEIPPLPKTVLTKLNQITETIYPLPAYTHLNPKAGVFIKRTADTPSARLIEFAVKNAPPEWQVSKNWPTIQETVKRRIFAKDLQTYVDFFKRAGVPANHPLIRQYEDKIAKLLEVQKNSKTGQDYPWVKILKNDSAVWSRKSKRLSFILKTQGKFDNFIIRRFSFVFRAYQRFDNFVTKKIAQPIIGWLAKTAVGKAVQQGAKKAATWIVAKLGMKLAVTAGVAAAGAATGPPGWVVAAATIALDILKTLGRKVIGFIRRIIQEPDKAFGSVAVGVLLLVFIPMPFALIAIVPLAIGGIGLASFVLAPATLTIIGGGIGGFFATITTLPFIAPVALFFIIILSVLAGLTLFIVLVVSGAFILPSKMAEVTPTTISPYESEYFTITKTAFPNKLDNSVLQANPPIEYTVSIVAKNDYKLTINSITEDISLVYDQQSGKQLSASPHSFEKDLDEIKHINVASWETKYTVYLFPGFENTAIINTVTATITIEGVDATHPAVTSAIVNIGTPPVDCPSGYPTDSGIITQGPLGGFSHRYKSSYDPNSPNQIAIDISGPGFSGYVPIRATHNGNLQQASCGTSGCGIFIYSPCAGVENFYTAYWHLRDSGRRPNGPVSQNDIIGYTNGYQKHLHYEFGPPGPKEWPTTWRPSIEMKPQYFPQTVPYECSGNCGISW